MGIDNGGTSSKAAIYDLKGNEISKFTIYTKMLTPHKYWTERDMHELKRVNFAAIQGVLQKAKINPKEIIGISCTGHGNGLYLIGKDGQMVRNGIVSTDNRAHEYVEKWLNDPNYETKVRSQTYQTVWASQPVSLLAWLNDNEPETYDRTEYVFMITDLVRYWLTDEPGFEVSNASGTSMVNQNTKSYDKAVFEYFGIQNWLQKMPKIVNSSEKCGTVTAKVASVTGLNEGTPVAGGLMDISACALSTGLVYENSLSVVTGTWGINQYISEDIKVIKDLFMTTLYPLEGYHLITEASPTSGSNLEWFIDTFLKSVKLNLKRQNNGVSIYDYCSALVNKINPEDSKLLFFPFIFGSNAGITNATAGFVGATKSTSEGEFIRAVYEGVAFAHKYHIDRLKAINSGIEGPIRISGGITHSETWLQIFADILQKPLELVNASESGALGTSMAGAVMAGVFPSFEAASENMVNISKTIYPNSSVRDIYEQKYALYKEELDQMASVWELFERRKIVKFKKEGV